jgi:hypothetical protein
MKFSIDLDEVAYAIWKDFGNKKVGRMEIFSAVANNFVDFNFNDGSWDRVSEEDIEEAYRIAKELYPELVEREDEKESCP